MKTYFFYFVSFLFFYSVVFPQEPDGVNYQYIKPRELMMNSHDPNLKSFPEKSFYKQKANWQYIIDTTWGPGLPLAQKQQIFNAFTTSLPNYFDGFQSLGITWTSWDSLKNYYYSKIDSTTSRGRFSAIMNYLCSKLKDRHTHADDDMVKNSSLNPGVPYLVTSGYFNSEHLGAVTTVLPDSSVLILRVVDNHPLNLEPGDIILGYEGIPWRDLVVELMEAELPNSDWWGNSTSCFINNLFVTAGMNWHLFDTVDIHKYSTGDTLHLSVAPLANLNLPPMLNNEQIGIPNIPFPTYFNDEFVTYGIIENTNIGYIYIYSHYDPKMNQKMFEAVDSLKGTDGLIIDMRYTYGGWTDNIWPSAFQILTNEKKYPLNDALRCSPTDWTLCPTGDSVYYVINGGSGSLKYESPIAVLLGPNCGSMGDINAYRLASLYNVRTFGKSTWAGLGINEPITNFSGWTLNYSVADVYHLNNPGYYLNRKEFPIDFPVWHNRDDVAMGKDAVVEKVLWWINNVVYPHDTYSDKFYYSPSNDSVHLFTTIENPNSHQLSARAYINKLDDTLIDSVNFYQLNSSKEWKADLVLPPGEEFYKISVTSFDQTTLDQLNVPNALRFTTIGPVVLDSISYTKTSTNYLIKTYVKNQSTNTTITNASVKLICNDPWSLPISGNVKNLSDIPPGGIVWNTFSFSVKYIDSLFPGYFNLKVEVMSDGWTYWEDSTQVIVTGVEEELQRPLTFKLEQNYPNPFNPSTKISWQLPVRSHQVLKVFNVLGKEIKTLVDEEMEAGYLSIDFNASDLPSGVYFYQLLVSALQSKDGKAGSFVQTRKMVLIK